jgi:hypothetical protein
MWRAALIWAAVRSLLAGARPGAGDVVQSIGPALIVGAFMALEASEMMRPKCPKVPPPKCVFDRSRVRLKKLPSDVDYLGVWPALNCWEYWVREADSDVLDNGILHVDVLGGHECLSMLLMQKRFWNGVPKRTAVLIAGYSLV